MWTLIYIALIFAVVCVFSKEAGKHNWKVVDKPKDWDSLHREGGEWPNE